VISIGSEFASAVVASAARMGLELEATDAEVRRYATLRLLHLSRIQGEPGYQEAVEAEAAALSLTIVGRAIQEADAADRELRGLLVGLLRMGVTALLA